MKKFIPAITILVSLSVWAADQPPLVIPSLLGTQQPAQQFVMSESDPTSSPIPAVTSTSNSSPTDTSFVNTGTTVSGSQPFVLPLTAAPAVSPPPVVTPAPANSNIAAPTTSAMAIGLYAPREEISANPFASSLDIPNFVQCKQLSLNLCRSTKDIASFATCLKRNQQPVCKQFVAFATLVGMSPKDDIDLIKHYKQLDLIHLIRFGANYPGVYYSIGANGDIVDLIFGPQTQGLDIRKDFHYPEIAARFPNVALFSIVDKLPKAQTLHGSAGLQLILRFQLLNGCHACEHAGYADIAYNFSEVGALESVSIQSMEPTP